MGVPKQARFFPSYPSSTGFSLSLEGEGWGEGDLSYLSFLRKQESISFFKLIHGFPFPRE